VGRTELSKSQTVTDNLSFALMGNGVKQLPLCPFKKVLLGINRPYHEHMRNNIHNVPLLKSRISPEP
jgi:hypothetical protein